MGLQYIQQKGIKQQQSRADKTDTYFKIEQVHWHNVTEQNVQRSFSVYSVHRKSKVLAVATVHFGSFFQTL